MTRVAPLFFGPSTYPGTSRSGLKTTWRYTHPFLGPSASADGPSAPLSWRGRAGGGQGRAAASWTHGERNPEPAALACGGLVSKLHGAMPTLFWAQTRLLDGVSAPQLRPDFSLLAGPARCLLTSSGKRPANNNYMALSKHLFAWRSGCHSVFLFALRSRGWASRRTPLL